LSWKQSDFDVYNSNPSNQTKKTVPPGLSGNSTVWDQILGGTITDATNGDYQGIDYTPSSEPTDPLMKESIDARSGTNPATGTALADPSASSPTANPVNGHEWSIDDRSDLQYACIFKLPIPRDCSMAAGSCDCDTVAAAENNPLCQKDDGTYGQVQYRAKGYPGRRQLAVLHGLDPNQAIAASICPANTTDSAKADYGYRPAIQALIDRIRPRLSGTCLDRQLPYNSDSSVSCSMLEATRTTNGQCAPCEAQMNRMTPDASTLSTLQADPVYIANQLGCACVIPQATPGAALQSCIESTEDPPMVNGNVVNGWCYVDPSQHPAADASLVRSCPGGSKQTIRFAGTATPQAGSLTFLQCNK
jgi:hypothetical protein